MTFFENAVLFFFLFFPKPMEKVGTKKSLTHTLLITMALAQTICFDSIFLKYAPFFPCHKTSLVLQYLYRYLICEERHIVHSLIIGETKFAILSEEAHIWPKT